MFFFVKQFDFSNNNVTENFMSYQKLSIVSLRVGLSSAQLGNGTASILFHHVGGWPLLANKYAISW